MKTLNSMIEEDLVEGDKVVCIKNYDRETSILSIYGAGIYEGIFDITLSWEAVWTGFLGNLHPGDEPDQSEEEAREFWKKENGDGLVAHHAKVKLSNGQTFWSFQGAIVSRRTFRQVAKGFPNIITVLLDEVHPTIIKSYI